MPRRSANGEGTIYRRKDGRYEAAAYFLTTAGTRKRIRVYARSRKEVHAKLTEAKHRAQQGIPVPNRPWLLGEYIDYWLEHVVRPNRRPKTYQQYESVSRLYLKPALGSKRLNGLTVPVVQAFLNHHVVGANTRRLSLRTPHVMRAVLSAALSRAQREELVSRNVARLVELPTWTAAEVRPWNADEAMRFLTAAQPDPLYPAYALLLLYGLRRGELLGLRWCDVDDEASVFRIRQQLQRVGRELVIGPVKTRAGLRDLPVLTFAGRLFAERRAAQRQGDATAPPDNDLVFTRPNGRPIDPDGFSEAFRRLCRSSGLRPIKVHHLRHTTATLLKQLGVPARDAQLILGHSQVTVTQQIYQHDDIAGRREALARVEHLLLNPDGDRCRQNGRQPQASYSRRLPERQNYRLDFGAPYRGSFTP